jgi:hypothetical protein
MRLPPRSDEKSGHAAVDQLWKHIDIDTVVLASEMHHTGTFSAISQLHVVG